MLWITVKSLNFNWTSLYIRPLTSVTWLPWTCFHTHSHKFFHIFTSKDISHIPLTRVEILFKFQFTLLSSIYNLTWAIRQRDVAVVAVLWTRKTLRKKFPSRSWYEMFELDSCNISTTLECKQTREINLVNSEVSVQHYGKSKKHTTVSRCRCSIVYLVFLPQTS